MLRGGIPISLYPRCCNCCEFNLLRIFCLPIGWQKRNNYHLFEWMKKKLVNFSVFYSYLFDALFSNDRGYYINFPIKKYDACSNILILARQKLIHQDSVRSFLKALDESKCIENLFISCKGVIFWNIPFNLWNLKIRQSSDFEVFQDKKNFLSSGDIDWFPYIYVYARLCSTFKHFKAISRRKCTVCHCGNRFGRGLHKYVLIRNGFIQHSTFLQYFYACLFTIRSVCVPVARSM